MIRGRKRAEMVQDDTPVWFRLLAEGVGGVRRVMISCRRYVYGRMSTCVNWFERVDFDSLYGNYGRAAVTLFVFTFPLYLDEVITTQYLSC